MTQFTVYGWGTYWRLRDNVNRRDVPQKWYVSRQDAQHAADAMNEQR